MKTFSHIPLGYKFSIIIGGFLVFVIGGLFYWSVQRYEQAVLRGLFHRGQHLYTQLVVAGEWVAEHQSPISPRETMATKELIDQINALGGYRLRLTSLILSNPANQPEPWEESVLKEFAEGGKQFDYRQEIRDGKHYLHFMGPLSYQPSCGECHRFAGYKAGDIRGGVGILIPLDDVLEDFQNNRYESVLLAVLMVAVVLVSLVILLRKVIIRPVSHLAEVSNLIREGDLTAKASLKTRDELQDFGETFNLMVGTIAQQRLALEEANRELEERVRDRTAQLEKALERLRELDRLKSTFISHAAHELKTPLAAVKGALALLGKDQAFPTREKELVGISKRNINRLIHLVKDMLDVGRIERGELHLARDEGINLKEIIEEAVKTIKPLADKAKIRLKTKIPPDLPPLKGDADRLAQVFINLIDNAVKFSHHGGEVLISAVAGGEEIKVSVQDKGIGMSDEEKELLFTPFAVFHPGKGRVSRGTGLGLAITKTIVEGHGGRIEVDSAPGKGTIMTLFLPIGEKGAS